MDEIIGRKIHLVSPNNKRKHNIIVVGTGLAGASAAASLAELDITSLHCVFTIPPAVHTVLPHRVVSMPPRIILMTVIRSGDCFTIRSKAVTSVHAESNTYRLAEVSNNIIDQAVAQGVPFAREYGGLLDNRSFGGAQVSRTFYARGQTGQQLLLGAYSALMRQIDAGRVKMFPRREMLDLVVQWKSAWHHRPQLVDWRDGTLCR